MPDSGLYTPPTALRAGTLARAQAINDRDQLVAAAFNKLPTESELKKGKINIGTDSGLVNAHVITLPYAITALEDNDCIRFRALYANTGAATIEIVGLGVYATTRENGDPLQAGDIALDAFIEARARGGVLRIAGQSAADLAAAAASAAAAAVSAAAASASASAASASAVSAAASAAALAGTSASSVAIALGSKSFTTQSGKQFNVGGFVMVASAANVANYMFGQVTAYSGTSLTVNVVEIGGSGTLADWLISVSGAIGLTGATGPGGAGSGDVSGPASATGNNVVLFNGATGKIIKDSGVALGSIASQNSNNVTITGGAISGITDLPVADGGTGASTAANARTNLGLAIGTDVQAFNAKLTAIGSGLTWGANKYPLFTSSSAVSAASISANAQTFLAAADYAAMRTALGVTNGVGRPLVPDDMVGDSSTGGGTIIRLKTQADRPLILVNASNEAVAAELGNAAGSFTSLSSALAAGVSGIDTGSQANNTWYYIWAIRKTTQVTGAAVTINAGTDVITEPGSARNNGEPVAFPTGSDFLPDAIYYVRDVSGSTYKVASTIGGAAMNLAAASATVTDKPALIYSTAFEAASLTLPAGYTYRAMVGAIRSTSTTTFRDTTFMGRWALFAAQTAMSSQAVSSAGALQNLSITSIVPSTIAVRVRGSAGQNTGAASAYSMTLGSAFGAGGLEQVDIVTPGVSATASKMGLIKGAPFEIVTYNGQLYWTCNLTGAFNAIYITGFQIP